MKIVQINAVCGSGSTGKICVEISKALNDEGIENYIAYTNGKSTYPYSFCYSNKMNIKLNAFFSKLIGNYGFNSKKNTRYLIKKLEEINPDIVHIHNIHGHDVDLKMLYKYLSKKNKAVVVTFHDCWMFTGYCVHFDYIHCDKWQSKCCDCPQRKKYSWLFDKSERLYNLKKNSLLSIKNMIIVTPSVWLKNIVAKSFLKDIQTEVINNGIDIDLFNPQKSNVRPKYGISSNKKIVLGIALSFSERKGSEYFIELAEKLDDDYLIVLIGLSNNQIKDLPENILGLQKTANQIELAQFYSEASVFVNPTLEDNFPTVNLESLACGTPVITFDTGGSVESITEITGKVVPQRDVTALKNAIVEICSKDKSYYIAECRKQAAELYDSKKQYKKYISVYKKLINQE